MGIKEFAYKQNSHENSARTCYICRDKVSFERDQQQHFLPVPEDGVFDLTKLDLSHCSLVISEADVIAFVNDETYQELKKKLKENQSRKLDKYWTQVRL